MDAAHVSVQGFDACPVLIALLDHVLHFDALVALLPAMKEDEILEALEYVAVSINGVLIAKR